MQSKGFFITGTDTGIGKTWSTVALMQAYKDIGMNVAGMKPVASGCEESEGRLKNEDALLIQSRCSAEYPYEIVNPYAFREPVAPHIAAEKVAATIEIKNIVKAYNFLCEQNDIVFVEGVGGWRVPLSGDLSICDMVVALEIPVVLVVGLRLGCINHALLTNQVIHSDNIPLAGWIVNSIDRDYAEPEKTIETLEQHISAPLLGRLPCLTACDTGILGKNINTDILIKNGNNRADETAIP